jgi:halogenation protein CepH
MSCVSEIVVIGGGPGGSTAATMLARAGHAVRLLERERFPRAHVGESLLPASMPILAELGVADAVAAAGFERKWGATMVWGTSPEPWSWYFRETNTTHPHAYQVWRPTFDAILLDNARAAGVEVRERARVTEILTDGDAVRGVRWIDETTGAVTDDHPTLVVDASGQAALVGQALGLRRYDPAFRNMAVYGYVDGAARLPEPDATNILVESYDDGWLWVIPLHTGWASVGAVVDTEAARGRLRGDDPTSFLRAQIARSRTASGLIGDAPLVEGPFVTRDWSYTSTRFTGPGYVLVGDAACFIDPLFSSGVHLALTSGLLAAAYAVTLLDDPELGADAGPVYQELYRGQYERFRQLAQLFYASNATADSYFWQARRLLDSTGPSPSGRGGDQPAAESGDEQGGDGERSAREDDTGLGAARRAARLEFIRAVAGQPPQGYERAVLERGALPPGVVAELGAAAADLAARRAELDRWGPALGDAVPRLVPGVAIARRPVLEGDRFRWGSVLVTPQRHEAVPVSRMVAAVVDAIDGRRSLSQVMEHLAATYDLDAERLTALGPAVRTAVATLHADGVIDTLGGPGRPMASDTRT